MNQVFLTGRIATDLDLRATVSGKSSLSFNLAVYDGKDADGNNKTIFIPCAAWDDNAERIAKNCQKGDSLLLMGKWERRTYEKDGQKKTYDQMRITRFEFTGGRKKEDTHQWAEEATDDTGLPF